MENLSTVINQLFKKQISQGYKLERPYPYNDESGHPMYWRPRFEKPSDDPGVKTAKEIRIMSQKPDGIFIASKPEGLTSWKLFNLDKLNADPTSEVYFVEGEKKVRVLDARGILATTTGGVNSLDADISPLASRAVVIWADHDEAGGKWATELSSKLLALNCKVRIVDVGKLSLPPKGDCIEWLQTFYQQYARKATAEDVQSLPTIEPNYIEDDPNTTDNTIAVQINCAADITPKPINWLWDGWLARGKFHIFAGQAGTGKTTIAITLAATISIGGRFPDETRSPIGNVLIWSGEDSAEDTLVPRLLAAGADLSKIHFIGSVQHGDEIRSFDPSIDIAELNHAAARIGDISLLIVDPVVHAVACDSHKNGEVRRALQPLVDFGEKLDCAVLGISHFSKGTAGKDPLERVTGSLAFGALARIVLATAKISDDETTKRIFCRAKSNIGIDHGGFEYDLHQKEIDGYQGIFSSYLMWGQAVEGSARELLAEKEPDEGASEVDEAEQFLRELLVAEAMTSGEVKRESRDAGYAWTTIRRAQKRLGIKPTKSGMKGKWFWSLNSQKYEDAHEDAEDAQQNSVSTFGKNEHLRENPSTIADAWEC